MHILFLSHYFPPEVNAPASRTHENCRAWARAGHQVTVLTCVPNHPTGIVYAGYKNKLHQSEVSSGIQVIRLWTFLAANEGVLLRTLNYVSFLFSIVCALPWLARPDVVVSTSPQFFCGLAGFLVGVWMRVPWVLKIRDLWPDSIVSVGALRRGFATWCLRHLERFAYRRADRIVCVSQACVPHIAERCGDRRKIAVIENGADLDVFDPGRDRAGARAALGLGDKFVAAYVGTLGMAHGLETVLAAACLLRHDDIVFLLVGDGSQRTHLLDRKAALGLDNVVMPGQLPRADIPGVWAAADVALVVLRDVDLFRTVLPSKMFEAMAMRCPVILGVDGAARAVLESAGAGVFVPPENVDRLAQAVVRLKADPVLRRRLGKQGRAYAAAHCDRAKLAAKYLDVIDLVVTSKQAAGRTVAARFGGGMPPP